MAWRWILWQVFIPLLGPIAVSWVAVWGWASGTENFQPDLAVIVDVSPWALTFYSFTLICSTWDRFAPHWSQHAAVGWGLRRCRLAPSCFRGTLSYSAQENAMTEDPQTDVATNNSTAEGVGSGAAAGTALGAVVGLLFAGVAPLLLSSVVGVGLGALVGAAVSRHAQKRATQMTAQTNADAARDDSRGISMNG